MLENGLTIDAMPSEPTGEIPIEQRSVAVLGGDLSLCERPPGSRRMRLAVAGLVLAHVAAGDFIAATRPVTASFMAQFTLEASDVVLLTLWLAVGRGALPLRCAGFIGGLACLLALRESHEPGGASEGWLWWATHYALIGMVVMMALWRPRLAARLHRNPAGMASIALTASFSQPKLSVVSSRFRDQLAPLQFSLRHIFYLSTAVAVMLMLYKPLLAAINQLESSHWHFSLLPGVVGLAAVWAGLSPGNPVLRGFAAVLLAATIGELCAQIWSLEMRNMIITNVAQAVIIIGTLFVLRAGGYRLVSDRP